MAPSKGQRRQSAAKKRSSKNKKPSQKSSQQQSSKGKSGAKGTGQDSQRTMLLVVAAALVAAVVVAVVWSQLAPRSGAGTSATTGGDTATATGGSGAQLSAAQSEAGWILNDPDAALAQAKEEDKLILIDFWADWCVWCKKMDDETYTDERVAAAIEDKYVALKIDTDKMQDLQKQFKAESMPTTVVLDSSGKELGRIVGFRAAEQFMPFLQDPESAS